jgi:hypothetical protein
MRRRRYLSRADVRQRNDKPTNSVILQYIGRRLDFHSHIYGYPEGTFFVVNRSEVPLPEKLEEQGLEAGINVAALPDAPRLQEAVIECLVAEAMVDAPDLLRELADPDVSWTDSDLKELQRRHTIAASRVTQSEKLLETDLKLRTAGVSEPSFEVPSLAGLLGPEPMSLYEVPCPPSQALPAPPAPTPVTSPECPPCEEEAEEYDTDLAPGSETVQAAAQAVEAAREAELPQRLPKGARRRIERMAPAVYIAFGDVIESRRDLCAGMTDGRGMGRKGREVAVISWDGEWPVVVRRYGKGGRVIYKVERALKKAGVEVA